jgi:tetratricopeptide (TPR) repeat protein
MNFSNVIKIAFLKIMGRFSKILNNPEQAAHYYETALSIAPDNLKAINNLQVAYKEIPNWTRFFELYHSALAKWPEKEYIKVNIGISHMYLSHYKEAIPFFEDYIQSQLKTGSSFSPNIYSKLGICYAYQSLWDLAERTLAKAEEQIPWDIDMIFGRLCLLDGTGRSKNNLSFLEEKIKRYPRLYPLLYWKADFTRNYLRQPEKSINQYRSALNAVNFFSYKSKYEPYYFAVGNYGSVNSVVRDYFEVLSETGRLRKNISYRTWWWLGFGFDKKVVTIYKKILDKSYKSASRDCEKLLRKNLSPGMRCVVLSHLSLAQSLQGQFEKALTTSRKAVNLNPNSFFARDILGLAYLKTENWKSAISVYQQLANEEPFNPSLFEKLGIAYKNIGDNKNAKKANEKLLKLDPKNPISKVL